MSVYSKLQDPEKRLVLTNIRQFWKDEPDRASSSTKKVEKQETHLIKAKVQAKARNAERRKQLNEAKKMKKSMSQQDMLERSRIEF